MSRSQSICWSKPTQIIYKTPKKAFSRLSASFGSYTTVLSSIQHEYEKTLRQQHVDSSELGSLRGRVMMYVKSLPFLPFLYSFLSFLLAKTFFLSGARYLLNLPSVYTDIFACMACARRALHMQVRSRTDAHHRQLEASAHRKHARAQAKAAGINNEEQDVERT